ncbi:MAG: thiamine-phosphate kinase [Pseudomonadota bacterium]
MKTMSGIGEKMFLRALLPTLHVDPCFINGFGHDASIIDLGLERHIAFKIDRAPFPVALRRGIGDYKTWGRLAVVANISDLLAVGGDPRAMMLSLVLPSNFDAADATAIVEGCEEACHEYGVAFLGGDTKEGAVAQVVGAALGTVEKDGIFGRASARPGDRLLVAGEVGGFAGTLALMDSGIARNKFPSQWCDLITHPNARIKEGNYLRKSCKVAAACDLSDGLADALDIFCGNGVGITLDESSFPMHTHAIDASKQGGTPLWRFAFGVGDWAIAYVVREEDAEQLLLEVGADLVLHEIGHFDDSGKCLIRDAAGVKHSIPRVINEHFRQRLEDEGTYMEELLHPK